MTTDLLTTGAEAASDTSATDAADTNFRVSADKPTSCAPSQEGGDQQETSPMTTTTTTDLNPTAAVEIAGPCKTTVAITGIVALLARSQARRLAEQASPANADAALARKTQQ
ncbi:hypothetical protein [Tranquillimonas rosea]|uniref:hypothetical protein n=1 Tax=Tranquillimonas rosea TaxID=641238 RepID=UPI003BAB0C84